MRKYILVIPARLKSSRFPGKPLVKIKGIPMIIRTANQCAKVIDKKNIYVATDSRKISTLCRNFGYSTIMTKKSVLTGTDRVAEVAKKIKAKYYINIQGDEPIFNPSDISLLKKKINKSHKDVLLGYTKIESKTKANNLNTPKVIFNKKRFLIYASRNLLPLNFKKKKNVKFFRQVLAYSIPRNKLLSFNKIKKRMYLEEMEDIEILRFIELGIKVKLIKMSNKSQPVDTKRDLKKVLKKINK